MQVLSTNFFVSPRRRLIRGILIMGGIVLIGLGFFRTVDTRGEKTLWVIDNSLSMAVTDIRTESGIMLSRLEFAKQLIAKSAGKIDTEQAIMSATDNGKLELPMTDNWPDFLNVIRGISPIARGGGSLLSSPLETIALLYGDLQSLHIIWITDGEFFDSGSTLSGFVSHPQIDFIGVGSRSGGPILEGYTLDGHPRYKQSAGKTVHSVRDDLMLAKIASSFDASLTLIDADTSPLGEIPFSKKESSSYQDDLYLYGGLILILFGLMFSRYHYFPKKSHGN